MGEMAEQMRAALTPADRVRFEKWEIRAQQAVVDRARPGSEERGMREAKLDYMMGLPAKTPL